MAKPALAFSFTFCLTSDPHALARATDGLGVHGLLPALVAGGGPRPGLGVGRRRVPLVRMPLGHLGQGGVGDLLRSGRDDTDDVRGGGKIKKKKPTKFSDQTVLPEISLPGPVNPMTTASALLRRGQPRSGGHSRGFQKSGDVPASSSSFVLLFVPLPLLPEGLLPGALARSQLGPGHRNQGSVV